MKQLQYTVIESLEQYTEYCNTLHELIFKTEQNEIVQSHIDLLSFLIEKWDKEHYASKELDPVQILKLVKKEHGLTQKKLAEYAGVGQSYMSEILNYKKGISSSVAKNLSKKFKISLDALTEPYNIVNENMIEVEDLFFFAEDSPFVRLKGIGENGPLKTTSRSTRGIMSFNYVGDC